MIDLRPPFVSVVIPTHNRGDLLARAVDSVLGQEAIEAEVIVVDDASTDSATETVLAGYGDRVTCIRNDCRKERGAARNIGARAASGEVLAFLDSDDEWKSTKLVRQIGFVRPGVACVTAVEMVDLNGAVIQAQAIPSGASPDAILMRNRFSPSTLLLRKRDFEAVGGFPEDRSVQGSEDWVFFVRLVHSGHRLAVVPEPLVRYRVHPENWTADPDRVALSMWSAVELMEREGYTTDDRLLRVRGRTACVIGRRYSNSGRWGAAGRWALRAVRRGAWQEAVRGIPLIALSGIRGRLRRSGV